MTCLGTVVRRSRSNVAGGACKVAPPFAWRHGFPLFTQFDELFQPSVPPCGHGRPMQDKQCAPAEITSLPKTVPSPHFLEECPKWHVPGTDWEIQGHSVAGERTGFSVHPLNLFLDAGMNSYKTVSNVLLTHSHSDHSFNVPCVAMGQNAVETRPCIYCPSEMVEPLRLLTRASQSLNDCTPLQTEDQIRWKGVDPGEIFSMAIGKKKTQLELQVQVVKCFHTVPSVGFIISEPKTTLKAEYRGMGKELVQLRKQGVEINETVLRPRLAFMGDTTVMALEHTPSILECPVIMIECTTFGTTEAQASLDRGHVHWDYLKPFVQDHPKVTFVLMHFSRRYSDSEIVQYFSFHGHPNVVLWLDSGVITLAPSPSLPVAGLDCLAPCTLR
eukprot:NODE_927_length_1230_cov_27.678239_g695_i0.p1 GENE.NODE_927_length_1230_cov_27.678239_g695_i0~~NODE_927_length_1230_cov_27.678239_g695_i0.p1  ORF type:complete len:409 (+),score=76.48 NODE_927_length_1230_cov_27.678239_g695_i0:71-1228(+)